MSMELGPYTNFHELNQDWFLNEFNKVLAEWAAMKKSFSDLNAAFNDLRNYVHDYFKNLDVQEEINNKLNVMAKDGTLSQLIAPFITSNSNPIFVDSVSDMNDKNKTYVLTTNGHIYVYRNSAFTDTGMIYDFNNNDFILVNAGFDINGEYLTDNPGVNITTLTANTFYRVYNITQEQALQLGLKSGMGTVGSLYITRPYQRTDKTQSFKLIEWVSGYRSEARRYYAYMYGDDTVDTLVWHNTANISDVDNAINSIMCGAGYGIDDTYLTSNPSASVLTLPFNTYYQVDNLTVEHYNQLGFAPDMRSPGSLYITRPFKRSYEGLQYTLVEYVTGNLQDSRKYFTFLYGNETLETITWHSIANISDVDNAINNSIMCGAGYGIDDTYLTSNPSASVLTLPFNTYYQVDNLTVEHYNQLGFAPDMRDPGTLYITRPFKRSDKGLQYTLVEYVTGNLQNSRKYFTFLYGNETLNTIFWKKVETTGLKKITNLANDNNVIYLIGDSIVEGYGGTGYNGGSVSDHSNEEIQNNVKTWYRNTKGTCWANMFKSYVEANYPNTTVINNGIGGLTCAQIDDNFDTLVGSDATMVIISCGTNDRDNSYKNTAITEHITSMVRKANMRGLKCVVLTNSPLRSGAGSKPNNAQTVNAFINNSIEQTDTFNVQILSNMLSYMELNNLSVNDITSDDLHPNDLGYKIMFNIIRAKLGM